MSGNTTNNPDDLTRSLSLQTQVRAPKNQPSIPRQIGKYKTQELLGQGGFGLVVLAVDEELGRQVAIKLPKEERFASEADFHLFAQEAKTIARLQHPGIVKVFDVGVQDSIPYIVLEYIRGRSLAACLKNESITYLQAAKFVCEIGEALGHAHDSGFVHRDIKPHNILLDNEDRIYVSDFGLALRFLDSQQTIDDQAGTRHYMAPEQIRGESHRVDGRTDIWSLGVVLYQLLTRHLPFDGSCTQDIFQAILHSTPVLPTHHDARVPIELERICMRCLSRQMSQRYRRADDLVAELKDWIVQNSGESGSGSHRVPIHLLEPPETVVVPRGLRSFERADADFFLRLLPGPRDRDGLPVSVRFWKQNLCQRDTDEAFKIGLLYGPSGCGKSSFVKAGLLSRLDKDIFTVVVECTHLETEQRLAKALCKRYPSIPKDLSLGGIFRYLREAPQSRSGEKVVWVLDQFEQWLTNWDSNADSEMLRALRQCDGGNIQCVILVRDDFWLPVSRLLTLIEITAVDGVNSMLVDSFDQAHAAKVLTELGVGYSKLPRNRQEQTEEQAAFIRAAIRELSEDGRLYPVRLAVFVEMVKDHPWVPQTLTALGGAAGVGVAFLENSVGAQASPARRAHQMAARNVLSALLPESGQIKDCVRSRDELLQISQYTQSPHEFDNLMQLLDVELRLITRVQTLVGGSERNAVQGTSDLSSPSGHRSGDSHQTGQSDSQAQAGKTSTLYQLTHDFLVPSIREWLERQQRGTSRGRALLLLQQQSDTWNRWQAPRYLPTIFEYLNIRLRTKSAQWTGPQARMMSAAGRRMSYFVATRLAVLLALLTIAYLVRQRQIEYAARTHAQDLVHQIVESRPLELPKRLQEFQSLERYALAPLSAMANDAKLSHEQQLNIHLCLALNNQTSRTWLIKQLLDSRTTPAYFLLICKRLSDYANDVTEEIGRNVRSGTLPAAQRFRSAVALAYYGTPLGQEKSLLQDVVPSLAYEPTEFVSQWVEMLAPIIPLLHPYASDSLANTDSFPSAITYALLICKSDRGPRQLVELLEDSNDAQFRGIMQVLGRDADSSRQLLASAYEELRAATQASAELDQSAAELQGRRRANLALALLSLGDSSLAAIEAERTAEPYARCWLIHGLSPARFNTLTLIDMLTHSSGDSALTQVLRLGLAPHLQQPLAQDQQDALRGLLLRSYREDPDPETHAVCELLLRKLGADLESVNKELMTRPFGEWNWYIDPTGQTMIVIEPWELKIKGYDPPPELDYTFAIASTELRLSQIQQLYPEVSNDPGLATTEAGIPVAKLHFNTLAQYCNDLTRQIGLPESECCFEKMTDSEETGYACVADFEKRLGYRIPLNTEWEFTCRSATNSATFYGDQKELADSYVWHQLNGQNRIRPVGLLLPNRFGCFDMLGNVHEICVSKDSPDAVVRRGGNVLEPAFRMTSEFELPFSRRAVSQLQGYRLFRRLSPPTPATQN